MTVATFIGDFRIIGANALLDLEATVRLLHQISEDLAVVVES